MGGESRAAEVRDLVHREEGPLARAGSDDAVDRGVRGVEERTRVRSPEDVAEIRVHDTTVAHERDALTAVSADQRLDGVDDPSAELLGTLLLADPLAPHHRLPVRMVGLLHHLDGDVLRRRPIPLGDPRFETDIAPDGARHGLRGLHSPAQGTRVHGVDALGSEVSGEQICLSETVRCEHGIGRTDVDDRRLGKPVSDENDLHPIR